MGGWLVGRLGSRLFECLGVRLGKSGWVDGWMGGWVDGLMGFVRSVQVGCMMIYLLLIDTIPYSYIYILHHLYT